MSGTDYPLNNTQINKYMDELNESLNNINSELQSIKQALLGTEFGDLGLVKRLAAVERKAEELEKAKNRLIWMAAGYSLAGGSIVSAIFKFIL